MERHPYFDLWLHDTQSLTSHFGVEIIERTSIHDWPLSCVQLLRLADGSRFIYKSQLCATSVEADFYAALNSEQSGIPERLRTLLPQAETLGSVGNSVGMIIEYIDAPRLEDMQLTEAEIIHHGRRLMAEIDQLPVDLPVYLDISTEEKWRAYADDTFSMLHDLIAGEKFNLTTAAMIQDLDRWSRSGTIKKLSWEKPKIIHGDVGGENVFLTPQGYKLIDWQRPGRGPAELDQVCYLEMMGIDPAKYCRRSMIELNRFIHLRWFTECQLHWFPAGDTYDQQVAVLARQILDSEQ